MRDWALLIYSYLLEFCGAETRTAQRSKKAPAPDPAIGQAAAAQSDIARQQLEFSKQQYADLMARIDRLAPVQERLTQGQIDMNDLMMRQAREAEERYKSIFQPQEDRFVQDASVAGSQAEQDRLRGQAQADVQRQIDTQRAANERSMASMGVNPNSGRFVGAQRGLEVSGALAQAGAGNAAAEAERARGDQMRLAAIQLGRGLSGQSLQAAGASTGTAMGANALGGANLALAQGAGANYMGGLGAAAGTYGQSANTYLNLHGAQMARHAANQQSRGALGQALGTVAGVGLGLMFPAAVPAIAASKGLFGGR